MKKNKEKVNFDLSCLTLKELIKTYDDISEFLKFLGEKKIVLDEKEKDKNE